MCGIWGIVSRTRFGLLSSDAELAKQMMLDTVQRGSHSTGLFITDYKDPFSAPTGAKCVGGPWNITESPIWDDIESHTAINGGAIIGHGRHATKGKITAENAHPFQHDHITLVHNGTIYGGLNYGKKGEVDVEVDSHALAVAMAEKGVIEALVDIHGPYAIIVHDSNEGCLYIARNKERPLYVYPNKDRFYIMSEHQYLRALVARNAKTEKPDQMIYFEENLVYKIDLEKPEMWTRVGNIQKLKDEKWEADRKQREEERKKLAAQNKSWNGQQVTTPTTIKPTKETKRKEVIFEVISIEPCSGGNYKYNCEGADKEDVYFQTDVRRDDYIGRIGQAKVNKTHWKDGIASYFIKHRSIEWDTEEETPTQGEAANDAGSHFRTANGKRIGCNDWIKRIRNEGCDVCDKTFTALDYKSTTLTDDDKLVCGVCASQFHLPTKPKSDIPFNILH